jgi:sugar lactone lactonase YvrE
MNHAKLLLLSAALAWAGCATNSGQPNNAPPKPGSRSSLQTPAVFATLPDAVATSDGMAIAPDGDLVVACPNFADQTKPGCLLKIGRDLRPRVWVKVPPLPDTGVACPMGIEFGPDGDLYVCDNQGWSGSAPTQFKGRMLRLRIQGDQLLSCTVIAEGMEHPNGVRVRGDSIYVTESLMTKVVRPDGRMVSGVYRFKFSDQNVKVSNTLADPNLITTFVTLNTNCPYGADGIVFDHKGNLYVGNFGDGAIHKITFDGSGKVTGNTIFAKTDLDYSLDPKLPGFLDQATKARMRTTDGICADEQDNFYVADFSNNAIAKVTPDGKITVLAQNGDTDGLRGELNEPGEPIVWKGRLIISNFNTVVGPDKVHTKHTSPTVMSSLSLP